MTTHEAHEFNIDVAQREIDGRAALGEDMTGATICKRTYAIVKPQPARILNKSQAEAFVNAMAHLNNVSAASGIQISFVGNTRDDIARLYVVEDAGGNIRVTRGGGALEREREEYADQSAFATAYGLA